MCVIDLTCQTRVGQPYRHAGGAAAPCSRRIQRAHLRLCANVGAAVARQYRRGLGSRRGAGGRPGASVAAAAAIIVAQPSRASRCCDNRRSPLSLQSGHSRRCVGGAGTGLAKAHRPADPARGGGPLPAPCLCAYTSSGRGVGARRALPRICHDCALASCVVTPSFGVRHVVEILKSMLHIAAMQ